MEFGTSLRLQFHDPVLRGLHNSRPPQHCRGRLELVCLVLPWYLRCRCFDIMQLCVLRDLEQIVPVPLGT